MKRPAPLPLLDCSTGHLSVATREFIDREARAGRLGVMTRAEGFFVPAYLGESSEEFVPPDLALVTRFARENAFDYILFDCDADRIDALPWYEDGGAPEPVSLAAIGMVATRVEKPIGGLFIDAVDPTSIPEGGLRLPAPEQEIGDGDYVMKDGIAWFTLGEASVRLWMTEGEVGAKILPLGLELDEALAEVTVSREDLRAARAEVAADEGAEPAGP